MGNKIVSISGSVVPTRTPNAACISLLEDWLERAKAGDIIGVAAVGLGHDGAAQWAIGGTVGGFSMLGALELARADLIEVARDA